MPKLSAILGHALAWICVLAAMACLRPVPAEARVGYWNAQCTQAEHPLYNLQAVDQQLLSVRPFINACGGGNWNACLQGREILFWVDMVIVQILNWNTENYCRNCLLNNLMLRAANLATVTRQLRAASGNQLTINTDQTLDVVRGHADDVGCCPPNTYWNQSMGDCQPGPQPPNAKKYCNINTRGDANHTCKVYEKITRNGLDLDIRIKEDFWEQPKGYNLVATGNCHRMIQQQNARCKAWRQ